MKSLLQSIRNEVTSALTSALGDAATGVDPLVKAAGDPKFGDYQSNVAMSLGKKLLANPARHRAASGRRVERFGLGRTARSRRSGLYQLAREDRQARRATRSRAAGCR